MSELRVGLLGYGLAGRFFHAPVLSAVPGLRLSHVVTRDPGRAAQAVSDWPDVEVLPDADELWRRHDVDLVVVAAPNRHHVELARAAVEAGLPVVVDKPLARTAAEAAALVADAARAGVPLTVYQNRRWDSDVRTAGRLLAAGVLGKPWRLETRFERWRPQVASGWRESSDPQDGPGVLLDLGSHQVDLARLLLGPVVEVYAEVDARRRGAAAEDDVLLALTHAAGARSTHWLSAGAAHRGPRLRLLGSRAAYVQPELDPQEAALRAGRRPGPGWGQVPPAEHGWLQAGPTITPVRPDPGDYRRFWVLLGEALRGTGRLPVEPADAVATLEVLDAARRAGTARQVQTLSPGRTEVTPADG